MSSLFDFASPNNVNVQDDWFDDNSRRKRISGQGIMLFLYSIVVGFALILVIGKNFETPEQMLAEEQLAAEGKRANEEQLAVTNMTLPEVFEAENSEEVETFDNPSVEWTVQGEESQPEVKDDVLVVEKGDHFIGILQKLGMEYNEASQAAAALKKAGYDVRSLQAGLKINITKTVDVPFGELLSVDKIVIEPSASVKYIVTRNEDEKYVAEAEQQELKNENKTISGTIRNSLAATMRNAGVPQTVVSNFANIFTYKVNFRSDIKAGDTFRVMYDRKMAPDGRVVKNGNILYAELNLGKKNKIALYRYKDSSGNIDYYDEKGNGLKACLGA